jgi:hypothetical protein
VGNRRIRRIGLRQLARKRPPQRCLELNTAWTGRALFCVPLCQKMATMKHAHVEKQPSAEVGNPIWTAAAATACLFVLLGLMLASG